MSQREKNIEKALVWLRKKVETGDLTEGARIKDKEYQFRKESSNRKIRVGACQERIVDFFCEGEEKEYFDKLCEKIKEDDNYTRQKGQCFTANSSDIDEQCKLLYKLFHLAD